MPSFCNFGFDYESAWLTEYIVWWSITIKKYYATLDENLLNIHDFVLQKELTPSIQEPDEFPLINLH